MFIPGVLPDGAVSAELQGALNQVLAFDASGKLAPANQSGGGVSDHGLLTGLADDDHLQYHTDGRALTWLGTRSADDLPESLTRFYRTAASDAANRDRANHAGAQAIATVTGLQTALDGKQPLDSDLTALAGLASAADKAPYFTGAATAALTTLTAFGRTIIAAADAAGLTTLINAFAGDVGSGGVKGSVPAPAAGDGAAGKFLKADGTWDVPGGTGGDVTGPAIATDNALARFDGATGKLIQNSAATLDDAGNLTAANLSGTNTGDQNVSATDRVLGRVSAGAGAVEEIPCTAAGRALLDDVDAAAQRTTLGLGTIATQAASAVAITGGDVSGITDLTVADGGTGASTPAAARTNLGLAIGVDVQGFDANTAKLNVAQEWTQQQNFNATSLVDGPNIAWDLNANQAADVTLAGNRALDNPTNLRAGGTYLLIVRQDLTGGRALTFGTAYKWPGGAAPTLTVTAGKYDVLSFTSDGVDMIGVAQFNFG